MAEIDEPIEVVDADPRWPALFQDEATILRDALGRTAVVVEHIGSTAVPGLAAKPIIDIQIGTTCSDDNAAITSSLRKLGYQGFGEAGVPGRLYFRKGGAASFNVHVVLFGGEHWAANLALRDYLLVHPESAAEYAVRKREAARRCGTLLKYSEHKAAFVEEIVRMASEWRQRC